MKWIHAGYLIDSPLHDFSKIVKNMTDSSIQAFSFKNLKVDPSTAQVLVSPSVLARRNLAFDDQLLRELLEFAQIIKAPIIAKHIHENVMPESQDSLAQSSHLPSERSNFGGLDPSAIANPGAGVANMTSNFNSRDLLDEDVGYVWDDVMRTDCIADVMTYKIFS